MARSAKVAGVLGKVEFTDVQSSRVYFGRPKNPRPIFEVASSASSIWIKIGAVSCQPRERDIVMTDSA